MQYRPADPPPTAAPGHYPIECSVPGHAEAGMVGTLVVGAAD